MSFGENLQYYRRKESITQEQLAEKMEVSRQTVSKWEAGNSYPEMDKILQLCDMFSCTMDTLMRGDAKAGQVEDSAKYDTHMDQYRRAVTTGIFLILLGVAASTLFSGMRGRLSELGDFIIVPFLIISVSVFVVAGVRHSDFVNKHPFILPFYPEAEVEEFRHKFPVRIAGGIVVILFGVFISTLESVVPGPEGIRGDDFYSFLFLCMVAIGVSIIVWTGMQSAKYNIDQYNKDNLKLRKDLLPEERARLSEENRISPQGKWCACIMLMTTVVYLIWSFGFQAWERSWLVYPVGGILCGIAVIIVKERN